MNVGGHRQHARSTARLRESNERSDEVDRRPGGSRASRPARARILPSYSLRMTIERRVVTFLLRKLQVRRRHACNRPDDRGCELLSAIGIACELTHVIVIRELHRYHARTEVTDQRLRSLTTTSIWIQRNEEAFEPPRERDISLLPGDLKQRYRSGAGYRKKVQSPITSPTSSPNAVCETELKCPRLFCHHVRKSCFVS
jgi:hypothetical protein